MPKAADLTKLSTADLATTLASANLTLKQAKKHVKAVQTEALRRYGADVAKELQKKDEPFGTVQLDADGIKIKVETGKKVEWDQAKLAEVIAQITADNGNPAEFVDTKTTLNIPELRWSGWGQNVRAFFVDARTVKPEAAKVSMEKEEEAS